MCAYMGFCEERDLLLRVSFLSVPHTAPVEGVLASARRQLHAMF